MYMCISILYIYICICVYIYVYVYIYKNYVCIYIRMYGDIPRPPPPACHGTRINNPRHTCERVLSNPVQIRQNSDMEWLRSVGSLNL